jgi:hypothetical protein
VRELRNLGIEKKFFISREASKVAIHMMTRQSGKKERDNAPFTVAGQELSDSHHVHSKHLGQARSPCQSCVSWARTVVLEARIGKGLHHLGTSPEQRLTPLNCLSPNSLTRRRQRLNSIRPAHSRLRNRHIILGHLEGRATMGNTTSFNNVTQIVETGGGLLLDASAFANMSSTHGPLSLRFDTVWIVDAGVPPLGPYEATSSVAFENLSGKWSGA